MHVWKGVCQDINRVIIILISERSPARYESFEKKKVPDSTDVGVFTAQNCLRIIPFEFDLLNKGLYHITAIQFWVVIHQMVLI